MDEKIRIIYPMIRSLSFVTGYPTGLPGIGRRKLGFQDRLNVLVGPNGSGKSTILSTLARAVGCGDGGWSRGEAAELDFDYRIDWDGRPVFYQDCHRDSEISFLNPAFFTEKAFLRSSGEKRIGLINELIDAFETRFPTYKLKSDDRPTILLDEIDNHIGFAGQSILWKDVFPGLLKKYQVIVSTHSIFPLLLRRDNSLRSDNIIQLYQDYSGICIGELAEAIQYFNR